MVLICQFMGLENPATGKHLHALRKALTFNSENRKTEILHKLQITNAKPLGCWILVNLVPSLAFYREEEHF